MGRLQRYRPFFTFYLLIGVMVSSCSFQQSILFQTEKTINPEAFSVQKAAAEANYKIQPGDYLAMTIYTNKGEPLVDPNNEFERGNNGLGNQGNSQVQQQQQLGNQTNSLINLPILRNNMPVNTFMINADGSAQLPLIGSVQLTGKTLQEANSFLKDLYKEFYAEPFVVTQYLNKRVIVMGAVGDQVIPLRNENTSLIEVLALTGNFQLNGKADKIRVVRGDLSNPDVQLIDLTTIEGVKMANLKVFPGDVIYVEPRRKIDPQTVGDINLFVSTISGLVTLYLLIQNLQ